MRKILFLDVDGVLNNRETVKKGIHFPIDPYCAFLVGKIQLDTGCEVVLSSSWRGLDTAVQEIKDRVVPLIDLTKHCCTGIRGVEIYKWIIENIPYDDREDTSKFRYAILDDEGDMLLWQKDHFFKTSFETGLTTEIANEVVRHLGLEQTPPEPVLEAWEGLEGCGPTPDSV